MMAIELIIEKSGHSAVRLFYPRLLDKVLRSQSTTKMNIQNGYRAGF